MKDEELNEHIKQLQTHRLQLQNLRKVSENGLFSLKQRMAEVEAELLKHPLLTANLAVGIKEGMENSDG